MISLGGHLLFQAPTVNTGTRIVVSELEASLEAVVTGELEAAITGTVEDGVECG